MIYICMHVLNEKAPVPWIFVRIIIRDQLDRRYLESFLDLHVGRWNVRQVIGSQGYPKAYPVFAVVDVLAVGSQDPGDMA